MKTTKLFSILSILLLLIPLSFALSLDTEPEECQTVDFYKPSTWISCGLAKMYKNAIEFLLMPLEQITEAFGKLMMIEIDIIKSFYSNNFSTPILLERALKSFWTFAENFVTKGPVKSFTTVMLCGIPICLADDSITI